MSSDSSDDDLPRICLSSRVSSTLPSSQEPLVILDDDDEDSKSCHSSKRKDRYSPIGVSADDGSSDDCKRICLREDEDTVKMRVRRKREEALVRKEALRREREKAREEKVKEKLKKEQEKKVHKVIKAAAKEGSRENRPGERLKQMMVVLDSTVFENEEFMEEFELEANALGVQYCSCKENRPGCIRWRRVLTERSVNQEKAEIIENSVEVDENELLVVLQAQGFVGLVHHSKQEVAGNCLSAGARTLEQYVDDLYRENPEMRISLTIEGLEAFMRGHKTRINRQFRQAVLNTDSQETGRSSSSSSSSSSSGAAKGRKKVPSESMFSDVNRVECEEALVRLQLRNGCVAHLFEKGTQLAQYVLTLTKALCESHYQKDSPFSFYSEGGQGPTKKDLDAADDKVALIWKHQLMQFNNVSSSMATAVVAQYPSPVHLLQAYKKCSNDQEAETLLKDVLIRRGAGVTSTTRKLGPVQSKRIFTMMTSHDSDLKLS